jgi:hypothetical protein
MKPIVVLGILILLNSVFGQNGYSGSLTISPETIMKITYKNNVRIKSAYYNLESAKYNFKLFESEYTQFNPIVINSEMRGNSEDQYGNETSIGFQKEFFDGSSVRSRIGSASYFGGGGTKRYNQYVAAEVEFPLFMSSRKLNRLIKRTFEENDLYSKKLEYVDAIRRNIRRALENYYDLVPSRKIYLMLVNYRDMLEKILREKADILSEDSRRQIKGEIDGLNSELTGWAIENNSIKIDLQRYMNLDEIKYEQIQTIILDFEKNDYFGKYYINEPIDSIFSKALANDTEFKILHIIKQNAQEKKRLAEKGQWDIFTTIGGRYYFHETLAGITQDKYFSGYGGLSITRSDNQILKNTIAKAKADIAAIDFTITDRKNEIFAEIEKLKDSLLKKKEQLLSINKSLRLAESTYRLKYKNLTNGTESIDVFLQNFRTLVELEENRFHLENNYLDIIRNFDYICGIYFEFLDIKMN